MKKGIYIGLFAFMASGCATYQKPPLDDAYYWEDKSYVPVVNTYQPASDSEEPSVQSGASVPSIEYLNVQDTTVTIRIKK